MANKKKYASADEYENKLARVMAKLGVDKYTYDWTRTDTYIQFFFKGNMYRFENSFDKAKEHGQHIAYVSDLFAQLVMALEDLARISQRGIYDLQVWIEGMKQLPQGSSIPPYFAAMGFENVPTDEEELKAQYRRMVKVVHPDAGGTDAAFRALKNNYILCQKYMLDAQEGASEGQTK